MELYLVQHGAAKSEAEDSERGLTDDGRRTVEHMAEIAGRLNLRLEVIEHSDKLRARQTGGILARRLRPAQGTRQIGGLAPLDDVEPMCARLAAAKENLMLVGHLPYLSRLVSRLVGVPAEQTVVHFQMGGLVRLDRDEAGRWTVRWVLPPEAVTDNPAH